MDELSRLRGKVNRALLAALWAHVLLVVCAAILMGNEPVTIGIAALLVAAAVTCAGFVWQGGLAQRMMVGAGAVVMVSLLLAAVAGAAWQIDIHLYYFATLAVLAAYCDRSVIVVATAVTALHHLMFSFLAPALVFSGGADTSRVALHAGILIIEAGSLFWLTGTLASLITGNAATLAAAEAARCQMEEAVSRQAAQHLRVKAKSDMLMDLSARFDSSIADIAQVVASAATELQTTSRGMAENAAQTTRQSQEAAVASDDAAQNVQSVATATQQLSTSISEIGQQVARANVMIKEIVRQAGLSSDHVQVLSGAAERIGSVVGMISTFAGRTNLLALNAAIEAARAGEAGKGFAVVAAEVKALATQTAEATGDIATQIKAIQDTTQSSARLIHGIATSIGEIDETTAAIAAAVDQQDAAAQEIKRGVHQAAEGAGAVSGGIAGVTVAARQANSTAAQVLESADLLSRNGEAMSRQVKTFLQQVLAA